MVKGSAELRREAEQAAEQVIASSAATERRPELVQPKTEAEERREVATLEEITWDVLSAHTFAETLHGYLMENVRLADEKAAFLFGGIAAVLGFLYSNGIMKSWLVNPSHWHIGNALAFVAVVGLASGAVLALLVVAPRFAGSAEGLIYWRSISRHKSARTYADQVIRTSATGLTFAQLENCYELAHLCKHKYRAVNAALRSGCVGLAATVMYLVFFA
jgi:Family of unknown function (DUF5706)